MPSELAENLDELVAKAGCSPEEFDERLFAIRARVTLAGSDALVEHVRDPLCLAVAAVDRDDIQYAAALLASGAEVVWTRDKAILAVLGPRATTTLPPGTPKP